MQQNVDDGRAVFTPNQLEEKAADMSEVLKKFIPFPAVGARGHSTLATILHGHGGNGSDGGGKKLNGSSHSTSSSGPCVPALAASNVQVESQGESTGGVMFGFGAFTAFPGNAPSGIGAAQTQVAPQASPQTGAVPGTPKAGRKYSRGAKAKPAPAPPPAEAAAANSGGAPGVNPPGGASGKKNKPGRPKRYLNIASDLVSTEFASIVADSVLSNT